MSTLTKLFQPLQIGDIKLQHRIVMAPLTRFRADDAHVHQDIAAKYYGQRARVSGTLLITEATFIAVEAGGYNNAPGIWSDAQIGGWKKVVDEVHANGSYIYLQLWSLGRGASPAVIRSEGYPYVSASPTVLEGNTEPAQELSKDIKRYLGLYAQAAKNAVFGAGFDGVEIHSANGYLVARFVLEIVDAVVAAIGAKKTAIRFSPWSRFYGMRMKDPLPTFSYVLQELVKHHSDLAYVHFVESRVCGDNDADPAHLTSQPDAVADSNDFAREIWGSRPFIAAGGFKLDTASDFVNKHENTAVAFGRLFLANPDLPDRLRSGSSLNKYDRNTFYTPGPVGYVDYPQAQQVQA